jgi:hypothetical protein
MTNTPTPGWLDAWLRAACEDADRRGLPDLKPMLDTLARAAQAVRALDATTRRDGPEPPR